MYNNALVIGRFQSVNLENEVNFISNLKHDKVVIAIVTPQNKFTKISPFDFYTNSQALLSALIMKQSAVKEISCIEFKDKRYSEDWTEQIDNTALDNRAFNLYILGEFPQYHGKHQVILTNLAYSMLSEPTKPNDNDIAKQTFRDGMAYAISRQFDRVYGTVDIAAFWEGNILLGRKKNEKLWRFIGGFIDPKDESKEEAAKREFREEAGSELTDVNYVCSQQVDDWRYKKGNDRILTTLYTGKIDMSTQPVAGDDIAEIKFFDFIQDIAMRPGEWKNMIVPEHLSLMGSLVRRINKRS